MTSSGDLVRAAKASLRAPKIPRRRLAVLTCMDARIDPFRALDAQLGDIHVLRNAGGVVTDDVIRSLIVSCHVLQVARVQIVMHTDCGMIGVDQAAIERDLGPLPFDLRAFTSIPEELERGVERLRNERLLSLPGGVTGYIYDVDSGRLSRAVA